MPIPTCCSRASAWRTRIRSPTRSPGDPTAGSTAARGARSRPTFAASSSSRACGAYHPSSKRFELFSEGGGNSWGLDFDAHGNLFYSTNYGGYALLHGVQGAYYWKQFGKHGALHNPYAYGYFDHVMHFGLRGGHVTVGGIVYQSNALGPDYRDKYIAADLLGHAVYWHNLEPLGSTFTAEQQGDLLLAGDNWFAPSDVAVGPDGAIYISDWHDERTAHPDPDAEWDRTNGRIYRIAKAGTAWSAGDAPRLADRTSAELVALLDDRNDWLVRRARRLLAERGDPSVFEPLAKLATSGANDHLALEALWALYASGGFSDRLADTLLSHGSPDIRSWTVRLLGDEGKVSPFLAMRLKEIADYEENVAVRAQLACTARRLSPLQALPIIERLAAFREDAIDTYQPLLLWWAVEQHAIKARRQILSTFTRPEAWDEPIVRDAILPRLMRRYAAEATKDGYLACAKILAAAPAAQQAAMLAALDQGLGDRAASAGGMAGSLFADQAATHAETSQPGKPPVEIPAQLVALVERQWRDDTTDITLIRLLARVGDEKGQLRAIALATSSSVPTEERTKAIGVLAELGTSSAVAPLLTLVESAEDPAVRAAALDALGRFDDEQIATRLLALHDAMPPELAAKVYDVLLRRQPSARQLLERVDRGELAPEKITLGQLRIVALHDDAALNALVKKHWGSIQSGTPELRLAEMRRINNDLRAGSGDVAAGRALFAKHCGTCHRLFGEGNLVGPELTHANRRNLAELLATVVDPSAVVRREYSKLPVAYDRRPRADRACRRAVARQYYARRRQERADHRPARPDRVAQ